MSKLLPFSRIRISTSVIYCYLFLFILLGNFSAVIAQTQLTADELKKIYSTGLVSLTGEQEGDYDADDYVVVQTMTIPSGVTVTFLPGTRLFIHQNSQIRIHGKLIFMGTKDSHVEINKLPFTLPSLDALAKHSIDTISIFVLAGGHLALHHTDITDSTIHIRLTDATSTFNLDSITGSSNTFTLPDTSLLLPPNMLATCSKAFGSLSDPCFPPPAIPSIPGSGFNIRRFMIPLRIVLGTGFFAAGGAWYYFNETAKDYEDKYLAAQSPADADHYQKRNHSYIDYRNITAIGGGCCLAAFSVSFFFGGKNQ